MPANEVKKWRTAPPISILCGKPKSKCLHHFEHWGAVTFSGDGLKVMAICRLCNERVQTSREVWDYYRGKET